MKAGLKHMIFMPSESGGTDEVSYTNDRSDLM